MHPFNVNRSLFYRSVLIVLLVVLLQPAPVLAQQYRSAADPADNSLQPVVAIHVSELTLALEEMPAAGTPTPQPPADPNASGYQWFKTAWHYYVLYESLMEALRSDGTPFVTLSDADIRGGKLLLADGSLRYPIMISLASEAISDDEITPLKNYVAAGGFLMVGSSAFTRYPDGSTRKDFAMADAMGIHMVSANLENWYINQKFEKVFNHRLVAHIPAGSLDWNMPLTSDEVYWGTAYTGHHVQGAHYDFKVTTADAVVVADNNQYPLYPLLTVKDYGKGVFIYHADFQPLIGFGGNDAGMYAYGIYRSAIQWAFESAEIPIVRVSPWRYQYNAAFILRHDFENTSGQAIEGSAQAEFAAGAKGDYYFCTGVLREQLKNDPGIVASLRRAVSLYGATIGPHNGGLKNPNNPSLTYNNFEYWHWGPDEAINGTPAGFDYALKSIALSFQDIDRWLAGTDNGRPGCGAAGNCPHIWVSPYFNSDREDSMIILEDVDAISMGEQKISPFPHYTLSFQTEGLLYPQVTLPVSDWFVGGTIAQSIESKHTITTVHNLVDAYYQMGALINLYGHTSSAFGLMNVYMLYSLGKPRIWAANSVSIADWWALRSGVSVASTVHTDGPLVTVTTAISGASDPDTAIDLVIPEWNPAFISRLQVFFNGVPAPAESYRFIQDGIKIKVGSAVTQVTVRYISRLDVQQPAWYPQQPR